MNALAGYFVDRDADGDLYIWAENGDYPLPVLACRDVRAMDLWNALVELVEAS